MVKVTVLYGHPADPPAFDARYFGAHVDLARKIPTVKRLEVARVLPGASGAQPPYYLVAEMWFDDLAALQSGMGSPEGKAVSADIAQFATGTVTRLISQVS